MYVMYVQVSLATFSTYSLANLNNPDERLTADKAFVALSLFNILCFPLAMLPTLISQLVQVSCHEYMSHVTSHTPCSGECVSEEVTFVPGE